MCEEADGPYLYEDALNSDLILVRDLQELAKKRDYNGTVKALVKPAFARLSTKKALDVEEQKKHSEQWRRYFKRSKYVLLKDTRKLTMEDRLQLDNMFRISKDLYKAYQLKQQFEHVKESSSREEAAKRLSRWIMDAQKSGLMEFIKVSFTYQNWSKEILNSFEYPYTNGSIEGCNNRIKVLKRISFGMPRFVRFRRRIMHIMLN